MKMIEAAKVAPLMRLLLFDRPNIEAIVKGVQELVDIHTIDAEVVTRCKDCEYYEGGECGCPYIFTSDGAHIYTCENDFCSYAEPKARDEE